MAAQPHAPGFRSRISTSSASPGSAPRTYTGPPSGYRRAQSRRPARGPGAPVPFRVRQADHGGLEDLGMGHDRVLQLDRGDPLAARLDDVLGSVDDHDVAVRCDPGHVAGAEPTVLGELSGVVAVVIAPRDPRSANLDLAKGHAVPRQLFARGRVADAHLHAGRDAALCETQAGLTPRPWA